MKVHAALLACALCAGGSALADSAARKSTTLGATGIYSDVPIVQFDNSL